MVAAALSTTQNSTGSTVPQSPVSFIDYWSQAYGVPDWITRSIAYEESGYDPNNVGDNGTSFGLFQLHWGGQGTGYTAQQLKNPNLNAEIGIANIAPAYQAAQKQGLTGFQELQYVADHSGHPSQTGVMPASYQSQLASAYQTVMTGADKAGPLLNNGQGNAGNLGGNVGGSGGAVPAGSFSGPSGFGYVGASLWALAGIGIALLGIYIAMNPFADLTSAIRAFATTAKQKPLNGLSSAIRTKDYNLRTGLKSRVKPAPEPSTVRKKGTRRQIIDSVAKPEPGLPF